MGRAPTEAACAPTSAFILGAALIVSGCSLTTDLAPLGGGGASSGSSGAMSTASSTTSAAGGNGGAGTTSATSSATSGTGGGPAGLATAIAWNGGCASAPDIDALDLGAEDFTVEFWIRTDAIVVGQFQIPMFKGGDTDIRPGWDIEMLGSTSTTTNLSFFSRDGVNTSDAYAIDAITMGHLYHVAAVRSGATATLYRLDRTAGNVAHMVVAAENAFLTSWTSTERIAIGADGMTAETCDNGVYGVMDDVRVYRVARGQAALDGDYNVEIACDAPDLVAYWRMDEGAGNAIGDCTATKANLVMNVANGYSWVDSPFDSP